MRAATYFDLIACDECGDMEHDLFEALDGALLCPDCTEQCAPQLVPERPVRTVYLPGDKPQK